MGDLERFHGKSTRNPLQSDRDLLQFYGKSAHSLVKILRCGRDDSVGTRIGVIPRGVAVWLHARGARRKGFFGVVPEKGGFQAQGPVFYGVVPEKGGFQARGSGFLWGRARKGAVSGTRVRFSMGRARKGAVSVTSVDSILPWHPKSVQSEDGHLQRCGRIQFNFVAPQSE